jgi:D-hexose-6-phosphate mutarotase
VPTLPDGARLEPGGGGLERLVMSTRAAEAHVYLHGAQVAHYQPAGERRVLWMSERSRFQTGTPGAPIRGGVPVCFPWFGPLAGRADAPAHGVARLLRWSLASVETVAGGGLVACLELRSNDYTRRLVPHAFLLRLGVHVGSSLRLALSVTNDGDDVFRFEEALHTYFAVSDARRIELAGLEGAAYVDKTEGGATKTMSEAPLAITRETDRVFTGHRGPIVISDPSWQRRIRVLRTGSSTAVVWNPWIAKAKAMTDFGDDEWTGMVCVEAANALADAVTLGPGETHELVTELTTSSL